MLDGRTGALLRKIDELCGGGGFKIVEEAELLSAFPSAEKGEREELSRLLCYLEERRFIEIKYAEGGMYCLCTLPEGRRYFEAVREAGREKRARRRDILLFSALGAFWGALAGTLMILLPFLLGGR